MSPQTCISLKHQGITKLLQDTFFVQNLKLRALKKLQKDFFSLLDQGIDIENALKIAAADGKITYEEVRQNLKRANFSDLEIEVFFAKYDKNGDGTSLDNMDEVFDDLANDELDNLAESDDDVPSDEEAGGHSTGRIVTMQELYEYGNVCFPQLYRTNFFCETEDFSTLLLNQRAKFSFQFTGKGFFFCFVFSCLLIHLTCWETILILSCQALFTNTGRRGPLNR